MVNKTTKLIISSSLIIIMIATLCTNKTGTDTRNYKDLNPAEFKLLLENEDQVYLLDTHIPEQQHIKGTSDFIPFNEIDLNMDRLPEQKSTPIAVYCRSGSMSKTASETLIEFGYENVYNLVGGARAWREAGYEFE